MHKAILGVAIGTAFKALEAVLELLITAYSFTTSTGENVVSAIQTQVKTLRKSLDDAVDGLP